MGATHIAAPRTQQWLKRFCSSWMHPGAYFISLFMTHFQAATIAVFPILADVVEVKTGSRSTAHWRIHFIRSNGWLRHSSAQLITLLDIDGIGQHWEGSSTIGW